MKQINFRPIYKWSCNPLKIDNPKACVQHGYCQNAGWRKPCFNFCNSGRQHIQLDFIYLAMLISSSFFIFIQQWSTGRTEFYFLHFGNTCPLRRNGSLRMLENRGCISTGFTGGKMGQWILPVKLRKWDLLKTCVFEANRFSSLRS